MTKLDVENIIKNKMHSEKLIKFIFDIDTIHLIYDKVVADYDKFLSECNAQKINFVSSYFKKFLQICNLITNDESQIKKIEEEFVDKSSTLAVLEKAKEQLIEKINLTATKSNKVLLDNVTEKLNNLESKYTLIKQQVDDLILKLNTIKTNQSKNVDMRSKSATDLIIHQREFDSLYKKLFEAET